MSKKSARSKKGDGNVPNFVLRLDGSAGTPASFASFTGSAPASPTIGSPTNSFTFGGSVSGSVPGSPASASSFNFGATSVSFGDPSGASISSPAHSKSFNNSHGSPIASPLRRAQSESEFSITPSEGANTGFSFGNLKQPSTLTTQTSTGSLSSTSSFSVAGVTTPAQPTNIGGFQFTTPASTTNTTAAAAAPAAATPAFSFNTPATKTPSSFSFGQPSGSGTSFNNTTTTTSTTATPAPSFTFGTTTPATTSTTHKPPSPASTFGSAPTPSTTTPTSTTPSFSFSKPPNPTTTSTETKPTDAKPIPSFTFGTPASSTSSTPTSTAAPTSGSGFSMGTTKPAEAPKTPAFTFGTDKDKSATTPTSTLGSTPTSTSSAPSIPSFSFGSTTTTTTSTAATTSTVSIPKFTFGTSKDDKAKDDKTTAGSTVTSSPFTFGTSAPANTATPATPAPPKPNVFSFEKILQDLAKTAAQPPNQVYALVTPALSGLQQNQVVHHTNFRIDNISLSTRFHELPEQAQKELDAMQEYIRHENQRCEYIANQKFPQHLNAMSKTKKDTELLSQQIDALLNTLKSEMEAVETFYDNVKDQLRHANDGCAVLEACKHPGHSARWLFGYSEDDDYFSQLTKKLCGKLEEYKKCIWEIERTAESWSQNKVQSPQDIAHIMRAQNQAFLALSSKVAALHESVNREKNYFQQYLRMCH